MDTTGLSVLIGTAVLFTLAGLLFARSKKFSFGDLVSAKKSIGIRGVIATVFATAMGAWILFSPAETTVIAGLPALIGYALGSAGALWAFVYLGPKLRTLMPKGHSLPEYVFARYGKLMYGLVILVTIFYMAVFLTAELTGIALAVKILFDIPLWITATIIGVCVLAYTTIGGLQSSIFTDRLQSMIILPLLLILFGAVIFSNGGVQELMTEAHNLAPELFNLGHMPGIEFGLTLIIAIVAANLFDHSFWQRMYAAKNDKIARRGFAVAGFFVFPVIIIVGLFGLFALSHGSADDPSVALFTYLLSVPEWLIILAVILAVSLIMSSMDSLLNGIVGVVTVDVARFSKKLKKNRMLWIARALTVVVAVAAILVSLEAYSVLYLFLIADLVCAAALFPMFYGMFSSKIGGSTAFWSTLIGIVAGALFFPDPAFSGGNLLHAFAIALVLPAAICLLSSFGKKQFDLRTLKKVGTKL